MLPIKNKQQLVHQTSTTYIVIMVFFFSGLLLHMLAPFSISDSPYLRLAGFLCLIFASYIIHRARAVRKRLYTQQGDDLYDFNQDVYHYSRHPIYLGVIILFIGTSFVLNSAFLLVLTALLMLILSYVMIPQEERILMSTEEESYRVYRAGVRMWF